MIIEVQHEIELIQERIKSLSKVLKDEKLATKIEINSSLNYWNDIKNKYKHKELATNIINEINKLWHDKKENQVHQVKD